MDRSSPFVYVYRKRQTLGKREGGEDFVYITMIMSVYIKRKAPGYKDGAEGRMDRVLYTRQAGRDRRVDGTAACHAAKVPPVPILEHIYRWVVN